MPTLLVLNCAFSIFYLVFFLSVSFPTHFYSVFLSHPASLVFSLHIYFYYFHSFLSLCFLLLHHHRYHHHYRFFFFFFFLLLLLLLPNLSCLINPSSAWGSCSAFNLKVTKKYVIYMYFLSLLLMCSFHPFPSPPSPYKAWNLLPSSTLRSFSSTSSTSSTTSSSPLSCTTFSLSTLSYRPQLPFPRRPLSPDACGLA